MKKILAFFLFTVVLNAGTVRFVGKHAVRPAVKRVIVKPAKLIKRLVW